MALALKRHDTFPFLKAQLEQINEITGKKEAINLSGAKKVTMIMKSGNTIVEGVCVVTVASEGKVEYKWAAGDTAVAGTYQVEFEIEWSATEIESVPNEGYGTIVVEADLANA